MAKWSTHNSLQKTDRYLVTFHTSFGSLVRQAERYEYPTGSWLWNLLPHGTASDGEGVAWRKCPDPDNGIKTRFYRIMKGEIWD